MRCALRFNALRAAIRDSRIAPATPVTMGAAISRRGWEIKVGWASTPPATPFPTATSKSSTPGVGYQRRHPVAVKIGVSAEVPKGRDDALRRSHRDRAAGNQPGEDQRQSLEGRSRQKVTVTKREKPSPRSRSDAISNGATTHDTTDLIFKSKNAARSC